MIVKSLKKKEYDLYFHSSNLCAHVILSCLLHAQLRKRNKEKSRLRLRKKATVASQHQVDYTSAIYSRTCTSNHLLFQVEKPTAMTSRRRKRVIKRLLGSAKTVRKKNLTD